jgi:lipopolysaccharide transport system ATP-binding protein
MSTVIKVENLAKQYRLGLVNSGTMRDDFSRWWSALLGKEDPLLKVGEVNDRSTIGKSNYVWALKDINFEVKNGEILGIIGRNGAGKSTLLKILSKVTGPSTGKIKSKGKIASLLEVGTGFHPELTGKENIYLNGAILGMRRSEISNKIDEIVKFAGIERYVDTPVKRYSSGMYVRLAFAVAAHLEPDILIIDEVLAVGDVEFQKKCLGKIKDVAGEGRTVLFVSHNMSAIKGLCDRAILLNNGTVEMDGAVSEVISKYLSVPNQVTGSSDFLNDSTIRRGNGKARFTDIKINEGGISQDPEKEIVISCSVVVSERVDSVNFYLAVMGDENRKIVTSTSFIKVKEGGDVGETLNFKMTIAKGTLRVGVYPLYFCLAGTNFKTSRDNFDIIDSVVFLNLKSEKTIEEIGYDVSNPYGVFNLPYSISIENA